MSSYVAKISIMMRNIFWGITTIILIQRHRYILPNYDLIFLVLFVPCLFSCPLPIVTISYCSGKLTKKHCSKKNDSKLNDKVTTPKIQETQKWNKYLKEM